MPENKYFICSLLVCPFFRPYGGGLTRAGTTGSGCGGGYGQFVFQSLWSRVYLQLSVVGYIAIIVFGRASHAPQLYF